MSGEATTHLLIEVGTEELPPKALGRLAEAFCEALVKGLEEAQLDPDSVECFHTPRRLAVRVGRLAASQPDRESHRLGPAVAAAFDPQGKPTPAAEGFARSVGVPVEALARQDTDKGERLAHSTVTPGQPAAALIPDLLARALKALPVPKPMRWGDLEEVFVRPVHWLVVLLGDEVVEGALYGQAFGRVSQGHRFHHPDPVVIEQAGDYRRLMETAYVVVDPAERRAMIREQATEAAAECQGEALMSEDLVDEVANLVEWPVAIVGAFEDDFLSVPKEALISSMEGHQRFFPVVDDQGELMARFIAFANIESREPDAVRRGLERVIRPRLADARFFWDKDRKAPLEDRLKVLEGMIYQKQLGSLRDKSERVRRLAGAIAEQLGEDPAVARRAALLSKCDLVTDMVYEFPELQGVMGRYYALADGESDSVAWAIEAHYRPRFAGDGLPERRTGRIVAIADKIDTLAGIFAAGLKPTGNKDPFALRRAALGLVRLLIEDGPDLDLQEWLDRALEAVSGKIASAPEQGEAVLEFVMERLRAYYADQGIGGDAFEAVWARRPTRLKDFHARVQACQVFRVLEPAAALAAANKRIGNLLRKASEAGETIAEQTRPDRFEEAAERELHDALIEARKDTESLVLARDYQSTLERLALLRPTVDRFFDQVLVMAEDAEIRANRLALLAALKQSFDDVADIGHLHIESAS